MFEGKTILTGVKPTGTPHLGNYLGAIKPAIQLGHQAIANGGKHYMFIADYHAINAEKDPAVLNQKMKEIACIYLAGGLDPKQSIFYRYSRNPGNYYHFIRLHAQRLYEQSACIQSCG